MRCSEPEHDRLGSLGWRRRLLAGDGERSVEQRWFPERLGRQAPGQQQLPGHVRALRRAGDEKAVAAAQQLGAAFPEARRVPVGGWREQEALDERGRVAVDRQRHVVRQLARQSAGHVDESLRNDHRVVLARVRHGGARRDIAADAAGGECIRDLPRAQTGPAQRARGIRG